jgi:uncharacterized protein (TIGR00290 family)
MALKKKISVSWSGGKDSAFALYKILAQNNYEIVNLHTVIVTETKRVGLHGIHESLIDVQARNLGFKLIKLYLDSSDNHDAYTALMRNFYKQCGEEGTEGILFGDIFLEDLKAFRDELLAPSGVKGIYPLWHMNTKILVEDFINAGFKTLICSANSKFFGRDSIGKTLDERFINALPPEVDPCGENGEFHTFVYDGPIFKKPVGFQLGEVVERSYEYRIKSDDGSISVEKSSFWFQDIKS